MGAQVGMEGQGEQGAVLRVVFWEGAPGGEAGGERRRLGSNWRTKEG